MIRCEFCCYLLTLDDEETCHKACRELDHCQIIIRGYAAQVSMLETKIIEGDMRTAELETEIKEFVDVMAWMKMTIEDEASQDQNISELLELAERKYPDIFESKKERTQ